MTEKTKSILQAIAVILGLLIVFGSIYFVFWVNKQVNDLKVEQAQHRQAITEIIKFLEQATKQ